MHLNRLTKFQFSFYKVLKADAEDLRLKRAIPCPVITQAAYFRGIVLLLLFFSARHIVGKRNIKYIAYNTCLGLLFYEMKKRIV